MKEKNTSIISVGYRERDYAAYISSDYDKEYVVTISKNDISDWVTVSIGKAGEIHSWDKSASSGYLTLPSKIAKLVGEQLIVAGQSNIDKYSSTYSVTQKKIKKIK